MTCLRPELQFKIQQQKQKLSLSHQTSHTWLELDLCKGGDITILVKGQRANVDNDFVKKFTTTIPMEPCIET